MANTFALATNSYQGRYLKLECTQTIDIANNRSKIDWVLSSIGGKANYYSTGATTVKINGEQVYYKARTDWTTHAFPAAKGSVSGTTYVYHDTKGEATITCSIQTAIYVGTLSTNSDNWVLDNIPRAVVLKSAPSFTDEDDSVTITFDNIAGDVVEELYLCIGDTEDKAITPYDEITNINGTSFTYTLNEARKKLLRQFATKNVVTVRYYLRTTIEGNYYWSTLDRELTIVNSSPSLEPTVVDVGAVSAQLTGNPTGTIISGFNSIEYKFNATPQKEASIVSYDLTCGGVKINNDNSNKAYNVIYGDFVFSVTDSRGNTVSENVDLELIDYIFPSITQAVEMEMDGETGAKVTLTLEGNYYNGSFGAVDNILTLEVKHTQNDGSEGEWVTLTDGLIPTFNGNTYTLETTITGLVYDRAYTFQCRVTDATGETNREETVPYTIKLTSVFDWGENDFNFNVPLTINSKGKFLTVPVPDLSEIGKYNMVDFLTYEENPYPDEEYGEYYEGIMELGFKDIEEGAELNIYGGDMLSLNAGLNGIYINGAQLADFVIEQGDNGSYAYRKWNSGLMEAWRSASTTVSADASLVYGAMYYTGDMTLSTTGGASSFVEIDSVQMTINKVANYGLWIPIVNNWWLDNGKATIAYNIINPTNISANVIPCVYIIGKWKN